MIPHFFTSSELIYVKKTTKRADYSMGPSGLWEAGTDFAMVYGCPIVVSSVRCALP
jgi:hypothetical protein